MAFFDQFDDVKANDDLDISKIKNIMMQNVIIDNDIIPYRDYEDYYQKRFSSFNEYLENIDYIRRSTNITNISVSFNSRYTKYAQVSDSFFVWLIKETAFDVKNKGRFDTSYVIKLTLTENNGLLMIQRTDRVSVLPSDKDEDQVPDEYDICPKIGYNDNVSLQGCENNDYDCDGIEDKYDQCPKIPGPKSGKGCPDADGDHIPDYQDACKSLKGPRSNRGCPNPPFSRFDMELSGSVAYPALSQFNKKEILDVNQNFLSSGAGFADIGFTGTFSLSLNIRKWIGLTIGYEYFQFKMDTYKLGVQLKSFLRNKGFVINGLTIDKDWYFLHSSFGGLFIGKISGEKVSYKFTPFLLYVAPFNGNSIGININYATTPQQINSFQLTPKGFYLPGMSATITLGKDDNKTRLSFFASYLRGTVPLTIDEVKFQNLPSSLKFGDMNANIFTGGIGINISLKTPKNYFN